MFGYFMYGEILARMMDLDPLHVIPEVTALLLHQPHRLPIFILGDGSPTGTMSALAAWAFYLLGPSKYAASTAFAILSLTGKIAMYRVFRANLDSSQRFYAALATLFVPSFVFWSSGVIKEAVALVGLGWSLIRARPVDTLRSDRSRLCDPGGGGGSDFADQAIHRVPVRSRRRLLVLLESKRQKRSFADSPRLPGRGRPFGLRYHRSARPLFPRLRGRSARRPSRPTPTCRPKDPWRQHVCAFDGRSHQPRWAARVCASRTGFCSLSAHPVRSAQSSDPCQLCRDYAPELALSSHGPDAQPP